MPPCHIGRTLSALIFAAALLFSSADASAQESPAIQLTRLKQAVVIVTTFDGHGKPLLQGTGFFIERGQIATNFHVVRNAKQIRVETFDGAVSTVKAILATDEKSDLALMSVDAPFARSTILPLTTSAPSEGESIRVISNPQGSSWKVTHGATGLLWEFHGLGERLQITAAIAPGSSGGPVINSSGQVVGIAAMYFNSVSNLNFAVPVARLHALQAKAHLQARLMEAGR